MTSVRERLAALEQADFDTFGEQEGYIPEADLSPQEWVEIRDEIWTRPCDDPSRFPDLMVEAMRVLGEVGLRGDAWSRRIATQSLREMVYRAHNGAWRSEIEAEPAWSLDAERQLPPIRRVETVVPDL